MTFKFRYIYNTIKLLAILLIITFSSTVSSQEIRVIDNKGTIQKVNNNNVTTSTTAPTLPVENDVWFDTTNNQIKIYDTVDGWKLISSTLASQNIYTANGALAANRILNGNANNLTFNNINFLQLFSTFGTQISSTGGTMQISSGTSSQISAGTTMELSAPSNIMLQSPTEFNRTLLDVKNASGTSGQILSSTGTGIDWIDSPSLNSWLITGNTGTNSSTNFLGTIDAQDLVLRAGNIEKLRLNNNVGQVLVNQASVFNTHPLVIRANGIDVLAFEDNTGTPRWHWNLLADGLNFVESNVEDYRLFLENGGEVGINTSDPTERLDVNGKLRVRTLDDATNLDVILTTTPSGVLNKSKINFGGRWTNSNTTTHLNTNTATSIPIFGNENYKDDGNSLYTTTGTTILNVIESGRYDIRANISLIGINSASNSEQRTNVNARIYVNNVAVGAIASTGYIRFSNNGNNQSSLHLNEILELNAGSQITIRTVREANSGTVRFSGTNQSSIMINKLK